MSNPCPILFKSSEFLNVIQGRRSVRKFLDIPVATQVLVDAIKVASWAPSGANRQPWHFTLVEDPSTKKLIRQMAEEVESEFYSNETNEKWVEDLRFLSTNQEKAYLEKSAALIIVSLKSKVTPLEKNYATKRSYYPKESIGIAVGFLLSALRYAGLATLTHTPQPMNFLNEVLDLDKNYSPYMIVVVGHPDPTYEYPKIERRPEDEILKII